MTIGAMIRTARQNAGLTQTALARAAGTTQATLSAYESNSRTPTAATLIRILAAASARLELRPTSRPVETPNEAELRRRGSVLAQVIDLAESLPARHSARLTYPVLARELG